MLHLYLEPTVPHISLVFREMWDTTSTFPLTLIHPKHLAINVGGIPHLAKNERDVGHPAFVREPGQESVPQRLKPRPSMTLARLKHVPFVQSVFPQAL